MNERAKGLISLGLTVLTEAVAIWSFLYTQSRALKVVLAFIACWFAAMQMGRAGRWRWRDLWWSWPLVILLAVAIVMFVLAALNSLGLW